MSPNFKKQRGAGKKNILLRKKKKKKREGGKRLGVINRLCLPCYKLQQQEKSVVLIFVQGCGIGLQG
jgi:hypothetical protein